MTFWTTDMIVFTVVGVALVTIEIFWNWRRGRNCVAEGQEPEDRDERIVPADDKCAASRCQQHGRTQIDVGKHAEGMLQPHWHLDRPDGGYFLKRTQWANAGAEYAAEEEREDD